MMAPSPGGSIVPPLQLSLGSSAGSGPAGGGSGSGAGMGALNQGDWIIQRTGTGNNSATPLPQGSGGWLMLALGAGVAWFLMK